MKKIFASTALAAGFLSLAACGGAETDTGDMPEEGEVVTEDIMAEDPLSEDAMEEDGMSAETMMGQEPAEDTEGAMDDIDGVEPMTPPVEEPQGGEG
ncbi:hypothetical protein [uncultured Parasphingopyxis sp.]|uniref:hypothetical protein n=1 Tax=uncultured Parasphingopyxis sp. TaxID=1547918 RepID=UPI00261737AE|nr:hypothetical protein [uncultured Parasphingopyxis sp.]